MDKLITFLRAQLDADERAARAVEPLGYTTDMGGNRLDEVFTHGRLRFASEDGMPRRDKSDKAAADHFARHDPARVLADVAAKRQIIELVIGAYAGYAVLPLLALPFAGHPDYREEFRP